MHIYAHIEDVGCIIHYRGQTYFGRTGESDWRDQAGGVVSFPEYEAVVSGGDYTSRPALPNEIEAWNQVWSEA